LLSKAQIFVLVSNWEGFPLTILEAMRAGLPVVASDVGGVREAVDDGNTGLPVPRGEKTPTTDREVYAPSGVAGTATRPAAAPESRSP